MGSTPKSPHVLQAGPRSQVSLVPLSAVDLMLPYAHCPQPPLSLGSGPPSPRSLGTHLGPPWALRPVRSSPRPCHGHSCEWWHTWGRGGTWVPRARGQPAPGRRCREAPLTTLGLVPYTCCAPGCLEEGGGGQEGLLSGPGAAGTGCACGPCPSRDPPLPVGTSVRGAGVQHAAAVAERESAGLPVLCEHCRRRRERSRGSRAMRLLTPRCTPHSPAVPRAPPAPPTPAPPGSSPNPPSLPGLLLGGAALGGGLSPLLRDPCASGALVAGVTGVTEVTGIVRVPGVTVALGSGGSVRF